MAGSVINPCSKLGKGVILNTCSSIDHECEVGDYCHISVGAHIAGMVKLDEYSFVGIGAAVKNNISICKNCIIGAGAVVVKNITESGTYIGIPAKIVKK
jgi:UDP-3-O-[3-hydroxymyristoyl] glucosamine N-acyltransferase